MSASITLNKIDRKRALLNYAESFADFVDSLFDDNDDESELPDSMLFTNPYTAEQMTKALQRFTDFYVERGVVESYVLDKVISERDLLDLKITIIIGGKEASISSCQKFS